MNSMDMDNSAVVNNCVLHFVVPLLRAVKGLKAITGIDTGIKYTSGVHFRGENYMCSILNMN